MGVGGGWGPGEFGGGGEKVTRDKGAGLVYLAAEQRGGMKRRGVAAFRRTEWRQSLRF